jgi:hypothetical protein
MSAPTELFRREVNITTQILLDPPEFRAIHDLDSVSSRQIGRWYRTGLVDMPAESACALGISPSNKRLPSRAPVKPPETLRKLRRVSGLPKLFS